MDHAKHGTDREAVATCHDCGAGVCLEHAQQRRITEPLGMAGGGRQHFVILCPQCHADWPVDS
ncbi:MAG: DUF2180 family protein [Candidatus Dormibacteraeota bacterium]|nr:DUF2180 family protein [Candidatus Dormibacteraeota bacterium]